MSVIPPPKLPEGLADWHVTVRHSPMTLKTLVVRANGADDAWRQYLKEAELTLRDKPFDKSPERAAQARAWLADAKRQRPAGTEILGAAYVAGRREAMKQQRGSKRLEDVGGFTELASVGTYGRTPHVED